MKVFQMFQSTHTSTCHCGAVELALNLPDGPQGMIRCNCSMCMRRGTIAATVPLDDLRVVKGADNLSKYQFYTATAKHYFCKICGIYTHHQRRSDPNTYGVNVACIEGIDPYAVTNFKYSDGQNHSKDR